MSSNERDRNRGESDDGFIEKLVAVNRVSKTVKGGRQFTFTALTVVGDKIYRKETEQKKLDRIQCESANKENGGFKHEVQQR